MTGDVGLGINICYITDTLDQKFKLPDFLVSRFEQVFLNRHALLETVKCLLEVFLDDQNLTECHKAVGSLH